MGTVAWSRFMVSWGIIVENRRLKTKEMKSVVPPVFPTAVFRAAS